MCKKRSGIPPRALLFLLLLLSPCILLPRAQAGYTVTPLTDNLFEDKQPQLNDRAQVVWSGADGKTDHHDRPLFEIFLHDGTSTKQITDNEMDDHSPRINAQGKIAWLGATSWDGWGAAFHNPFLYDNGITQLSNNNRYSDSVRINPAGQVVWHAMSFHRTFGRAGWVFFHNGTETLDLSEYANYPLDRFPRIDARGRVVWSGNRDGQHILMFDGGEIKKYLKVTMDSESLEFNDLGQLVWKTDSGIYFHDGAKVVHLNQNMAPGDTPRLNNNGHVAWVGYDGNDYEIFLYDGMKTIQLTSNRYDDTAPAVNDNGEVVWVGRAGESIVSPFIPPDGKERRRDEIFLYDGKEIIQLTQNLFRDHDVTINNQGDIAWVNGEGNEAEIHLARKDGNGGDSGDDSGVDSTALQWGSRGEDTFYCLDILGENGNMLRRAIACDEGLHRYELSDLDLPQGIYSWKVWSPSGYGGEGFEGLFDFSTGTPAPEFASSYDRLGWSYRGVDTFYCVDIMDRDRNMLFRAAACGEGLHSYSPRDLNLPLGTYHWKTWSPSGYGGLRFEGSFIVTCDPFTGTIDWVHRFPETTHCVDIFDKDWNMIHRAAYCGDETQYSPGELGLPPGEYHWKIWAKSGYGGDGYEGSFSIDCGVSSP